MRFEVRLPHDWGTLVFCLVAFGSGVLAGRWSLRFLGALIESGIACDVRIGGHLVGFTSEDSVSVCVVQKSQPLTISE